jgi:hypothetical protein
LRQREIPLGDAAAIWHSLAPNLKSDSGPLPVQSNRQIREFLGNTTLGV